MTGNRIQEEIGMVQLIWEGMTLREIKSPAHSHQFILFFGDEEREVCKEKRERRGKKERHNKQKKNTNLI